MRHHKPDWPFIAACVCLCCGLLTAIASSIPPDRPRAEKNKDKLLLPEAKLDGWYKLDGKQGKKSYAGMAMLRKIDDVYFVQFMLEGGSQTKGIGIRTGDKLAVGWTTGDGTGVTVYQIDSNGVLTGHWASLPTDGQQHQETLTYTSKLTAPARADDP